MKKRGSKYVSIYGAYDRETDALIALGTAAEVARMCHITVDSLYCYVARGTGKYEYVNVGRERKPNACI